MAQHAPFPQERVNTAIGAASQEGIDWETVRRRMSSTPENITHAMADDYMKVNAEFRSKAGIDTYIERRDDGNCCLWCSKLAGRYRYPENIPKDVFKRHDNCGCLVSYENTRGGGRQNVHTKRDWSDEDQREYLKQLDEDKKRKREERKARWGDSYDKVRRERIVFSPKEAAERERSVLEKIAKNRQNALTKERERGIIKEELKPMSFDSKFDVKESVLNSTEYRKKFNSMSDDPTTAQSYYEASCEILRHRSGNNGEDLYYHDTMTNKWYKSISSKYAGRAIKNKEISLALSECNRGTIVAFHNHANSLLPSIDDLNAAYDYGYKKGYILCHNGKIYEYTTPATKVDSEAITSKAIYYYTLGADEQTAWMTSFLECQQAYGYTIREVF